MIHSTSNQSGQPRADAISASTRKAAPSAAASVEAQDTLSSDNTDALQAALAATPEIRSDVVAEGKRLAVDANYPPRAIIENIAKLFTQSKDLSETD